MRRPHLGFLASVLFLAWAPAAFADTQEKKPEVQGQECRGCHEDKLAAFDRTPHAGMTDGCVTCHKGGEDHLKGRMDGKDTPGPKLTAMAAADANAVCQTCHEKSHNPAWLGSAHARRGVRCTDCHSVHEPKSPQHQLKTASDPETCYACHPAIRAQELRTSHHPVREGLMSCTSCHNPHGSNHDKLLVSQQPWLCQRCHLSTRHPGTLYSGVNAGTSVELSSNRATEHACKNCHQNIHGGNAPSGPYLGR